MFRFLENKVKENYLLYEALVLGELADGTGLGNCVCVSTVTGLGGGDNFVYIILTILQN